VRPSPKNLGERSVFEEFILAMCKDSARDKLLPNPFSITVNWLWDMGYGIWVMGYGLWVMGYGIYNS
jgi:hypothetical protein